MSSLTRYEFSSEWLVDASPDEAYAALHDLASYPKWWPEVKEAHKIDEDRFVLRCRSFLPYDLIFETARGVEDPEARILEAKMTGDLEGFSRWTITAHGKGARIVFDEVVITNKKLLNAIAPVARPAFKANHAVMMRHGLRGLKTFLAGYRLAREGERAEGAE